MVSITPNQHISGLTVCNDKQHWGVYASAHLTTTGERDCCIVEYSVISSLVLYQSIQNRSELQMKVKTTLSFQPSRLFSTCPVSFYRTDETKRTPEFNTTSSHFSEDRESEHNGLQSESATTIDMCLVHIQDDWKEYLIVLVVSRVM